MFKFGGRTFLSIALGQVEYKPIPTKVDEKDDEKNIIDFKGRMKYRRRTYLYLFIFVLPCIFLFFKSPLIILGNYIYLSSPIFLLLALRAMNKYRCPRCEQAINPFKSKRMIHRCHNCKVELIHRDSPNLVEGYQSIDVVSQFERMFAFLIDLAVVILIEWIIISQSSSVIAIAIPIIIFFMYKTICEWIFGRTLGKKILKFKVVDFQGRIIKFYQAFMRNIPILAIAVVGILLKNYEQVIYLMIISFMVLYWPIAAGIMTWDNQSRTLHDWIAKTFMMSDMTDYYNNM